MGWEVGGAGNGLNEWVACNTRGGEDVGAVSRLWGELIGQGRAPTGGGRGGAGGRGGRPVSGLNGMETGLGRGGPLGTILGQGGGGYSHFQGFS